MTLIEFGNEDPTCGPIVPMGRHPFKNGGPFQPGMECRSDSGPVVEPDNELFIAAPPYISIDLETTGLDHTWCQILEVGAVVDDWKSPLSDLSRFHTYIVHDQIIGEPYGLAMNAAILKRIADRDKPENREFNFTAPGIVLFNLKRFLITHNVLLPGAQTVAAGKNFARFDDRFLEKLPQYRDLNLLHRCIDPGMFHWDPRIDRKPPSTEECLRRAGLSTDVKHDAINDALDVIRLIRTAVGVPC